MKKSTSLILLSIFLFAACKKYIQIPPPSTELVDVNVFDNDQNAKSAVAGMYSDMYNTYNPNNTFNGNMTYLPGMTSDELYYFPNSTYNEFINNSISPNNTLVEIAWSDPYRVIYEANAIIQGLQHSSGVTASLKSQLTGEARFIRAFCNFYLVNLFGDVPLVTSTDIDVNTGLSRAPASDVYQQIISDLQYARDTLAADYANSNGEKTRANKWTATALLARVYLYTKDWQEAELQASSVINNTALFGIIPDLNSVFLKNSKEAIWQINTAGSSTDEYTSEGAQFIPGSTTPNYVLDSVLLSAFEPGDQRMANWISSINYNGRIYNYPFKYKDASTSTSTNGGEYYMVLRLSEQYLIRAEARAEQNKITDAQSDLNIVRNRAGLPNTVAADSASLLLALQYERQTELFCEWGQRWFDLKRTGRINPVLQAEKPTFWKPDAALFPIPATEISSNPKLKQNPGY